MVRYNHFVITHHERNLHILDPEHSLRLFFNVLLNPFVSFHKLRAVAFSYGGHSSTNGLINNFLAFYKRWHFHIKSNIPLIKIKNIKTVRGEPRRIHSNVIIPLFLLLLFIPTHPQNPQQLKNQAEQLINQEQFLEAHNLLQTINTHEITSPQEMFQLSITCCKAGLIDTAIELCSRAHKYFPHSHAILYNIGYYHKLKSDFDSAITIYDRVLEKDPNYEHGHLALALSLLQNEQFERGWKEHEWNLKKQGKWAPKLKTFIETNTLKGKRIVLTPEGGLGDTLHYIRYAQKLKQHGAYVLACVQKTLYNLLRNCPYIDELLQIGDAWPHYDAKATLMTMPALFADNLDTLPHNVPYVFADKKLIQSWGKKLSDNTHIKIGLCWQADVLNDSSRLPIARRGIPLSAFFSCADIESMSWYSLQKYDGVEQLESIPNNFNLKTFDHLDEQHGPFMDTAAIMHNLDLIITVDTAIAHLAGALGKPIWLLLPYATDARWLCNRDDSPWYPTMRIFKQPSPFDWESVIHEVHNHLAHYSI